MSLLQRLQSYPIRIAAGALAFVALGAAAALALEPPPRFMPLLATGKTIMGETIVYPTSGPAKLTTGVIAMLPGTETGWHTHGVPLTGLVLEGELTVDYGARGKHTFKAGDSVAEAINVPHNGRNTGTSLMRLFVVFIGAEGLPTSLPAKP